MAPSRAVARLPTLFSSLRGQSSQSSRSCTSRSLSSPSSPRYTSQQQPRIRHSAPRPSPRLQPGSSSYLPSRQLISTYGIRPLHTPPYSQTYCHGAAAAPFTHGCGNASRGSSSHSQMPARGLRSSGARTLRSRDTCRRAYSSVAEQQEQEAVKGEGTAAGPEAPDYLDEKERAIFEKLNAELAPNELEVQDISGGCGSMYAISITSAKFKGLPVIRQHRLVNTVLGEQIKSWHGVQLRTKAP